VPFSATTDELKSLQQARAKCLKKEDPMSPLDFDECIYNASLVVTPEKTADKRRSCHKQKSIFSRIVILENLALMRELKSRKSNFSIFLGQIRTP